MLYMFLAEGFEETEAIGALDVIRRGGVDVLTVGIDGEYVTGSHGVTVKADICSDGVDYSKMDGIILPGGMPGTDNLDKSDAVEKAIAYCAEKNLLLAAICAAPLVFGKRGVLRGRKATCFPGFEEYLDGAENIGARVESDGNVITGKGAGAALLFGARIVDYFKPKTGADILKSMQCAGEDIEG